MTDTRTLDTGSRNAVLYLIGSLLQGLGLLVIQPFAIRILPAAQWGLVSTSVVTIQVVVVLLSSGLPLEITRLWFEPAGGRIRSRSLHTILSCATLLIGIVGAAILWAASGASSDALPLIFALICIGLTGSVLGAQAVLRAQGRPTAFVGLSIGSSVVANFAGFLAIVWWGASASVYLGAYTVAVALTAIWSQSLVRPVPFGSALGIGRHAAHIALPLIPHTGALMLLTQGAVWLLALSASVSDAGQYGAVLIFALGPITVLNALNNAWTTDMMGASHANRDATMRRITRSAVAIGFLVGVLASSAGSVGSIVLSTAPDILGPIARTLPLLSVGYALFLVGSNELYVVAKTRVLGLISPLTLLLAFVSALPFALSHRLEGVAVVHALGFVVLGLVTAGVAFRRKAFSLVVLACTLSVVHAGVISLLGLAPINILSAAAQFVGGLVLVGLAAGYLMRKRTSVSS
ncbi:hypothetical protein [Sinomonas sp. ASV322]|uniref:lipopolysaccharide biosynthesis protein n=1 Tax=Sinomonas sp. ASV322 TaxID=3041920 RepID=UPI0027DE0350|nr:hypothetical protein [Sinomonas sp. ASV322]MDQ4503241.1 hypothetical protein [Sinomonas sp. ASV322]